MRNVLQNDFVRMTYTELVDLVRRDAEAGKVIWGLHMWCNIVHRRHIVAPKFCDIILAAILYGGSKPHVLV